MHLSFASPWVDPRGTQGEWYSFGISFFPAGEGSCLGLEKTSLDHGDISTGFVRGRATGKVKVLYLVPWSMCENEQRACKKIRCICLLFLPMKIKYYTLV